MDDSFLGAASSASPICAAHRTAVSGGWTGQVRGVQPSKTRDGIAHWRVFRCGLGVSSTSTGPVAPLAQL
jgi:hypothetical protein